MIDLDQYAKCMPLSRDQLIEQHLPDAFINRIERVRGLYAYWLQHPTKVTSEVVEFDMEQFDIRKTQAYEDIALVKALIGDIQSSTKAFARWRANVMIEQDIQRAREDGDWRAVASMQKNYILNNKTDKDDPIELEFDKIVPQQFEMTDDISIVIPGAKKASRQRVEELLRKYHGKKTPEAEDANFEEVKQ